MSTREIQAKITGDPSGFEGAMRQAERAAKEAFSHIEVAAQPLTSVFERVNGAMLALGAILAGGAVFKESIDETVKFYEESRKLGDQMGISAARAGTLNVALGDVGSNAETFAGLANKLTTQLRTNEGALNALGLSTRDANGNLRDTQDLMLDSLKLLGEYKEGTDRNAAAQVLFGKGAGELDQRLLGLGDAMQEVQEKQQSLGLVVGERGAAAAVAYKKAMNDVSDVLLAMKKAVGDALLPVLTEMGKWFSDIGPGAVIVIRGAIGGLISVFYGLEFTVQAVIEAVKVYIQDLAVRIASIVAAAQAALKGDWAGVTKAWQLGSEQIRDQNAAAMDRVAEKAQQTRDKIWALFAQDPPATKAATGGRTFTGAADSGSDTGKFDDSAIKVQEAITKGIEKRKLEAVEFDKQMAQLELSNHEITKQKELALELQFENRRYDIEHDALVKRLELMKSDPNVSPDKLEEVHQEILALEQKHADAVTLINKKVAIEANAEWRKSFEGMVSTVGSSLDGVFKKVVSGTETMGNAIKSVFTSITDWAIQSLIQLGERWIANNLLVETSDKVKGAAVIQTAAAEAGANATASAAQSDPYGAVAIGAGVMAASLAAFEIASAAGGYDIPAGMNPITQLHAREMVLPAEHADTIRGLAGGRAGGDLHVHITAMDSQDVVRALQRNGALRSVLLKMSRNFSVS